MQLVFESLELNIGSSYGFTAHLKNPVSELDILCVELSM